MESKNLKNKQTQKLCYFFRTKRSKIIAATLVFFGILLGLSLGLYFSLASMSTQNETSSDKPVLTETTTSFPFFSSSRQIESSLSLPGFESLTKSTSKFFSKVSYFH